VLFISETPGSVLDLISLNWRPQALIKFDKRSNDREDEIIDLEEFISVKGLKAQGNKLTKYKVKSIEEIDPLPYTDDAESDKDDDNDDNDGGDDGGESVTLTPNGGNPPKNPSSTTLAPTPAEPVEKKVADKPVTKVLVTPEPSNPKQKEDNASPVEESASSEEQKEESSQETEEPKSKPRIEIRKKDDSFGAGSQITLEL